MPDRWPPACNKVRNNSVSQPGPRCRCAYIIDHFACVSGWPAWPVEEVSAGNRLAKNIRTRPITEERGNHVSPRCGRHTICSGPTSQMARRRVITKALLLSQVEGMFMAFHRCTWSNILGYISTGVVIDPDKYFHSAPVLEVRLVRVRFPARSLRT